MGFLHANPLPAFLFHYFLSWIFLFPCLFDLFPALIPSPALSSIAQSGCFSPPHQANSRGGEPWALHSQAQLARGSPGLAAYEQILVLTWAPLSWELQSGSGDSRVRWEAEIGGAAANKHKMTP